MSPTTQEAQTLKCKLETDIRGLLVAFETQTGLAVIRVELMHHQVVGSRIPSAIAVAVDVRL